jgi:hypothetical protein
MATSHCIEKRKIGVGGESVDSDLGRNRRFVAMSKSISHCNNGAARTRNHRMQVA